MKILVFLPPYEEAKQFNKYFKQFLEKVAIPMLFGEYREDKCQYVYSESEEIAREAFKKNKDCTTIFTSQYPVDIWIAADEFGIKNIWKYNVWEEQDTGDIRMETIRMKVHHEKHPFGVRTFARPYPGRITW